MKKLLFILLLFSVVLSGCGKKEPQAAGIPNGAEAEIKEFEREVPSDFKFDGTLEEFKEFFNSISTNLSLQVYIDDYKVDKGKFEAVLFDQLFHGTRLMGDLDENDKVKKIVLICEKAEEKYEILRYNLLMQSIITVATPNEMGDQEKENLLGELGIPKDDVTLKDGIKTKKRNNHTYSLEVKGDRLVFTLTI